MSDDDRSGYTGEVEVGGGPDVRELEHLTITKVDDKVKISFAYDKEVPLFGPAFLLIKYKGESH